MGARPSKATDIAPTQPSETSRPPPSSSSWSDLPPELAGLVLRRFPSLTDRVRFSSVCRHWHHATQQHTPAVLPPVFPWTITACTTGRVQTIPDGAVRRLCSTSKLATCSCSSESWLLMIGRASAAIDTAESRNFLLNPISGATLPMPGIGKPDTGNLLNPGGVLCDVTKFIVCADNLIVATIETSYPPKRNPVIAWCRPGMSSCWSMSSGATAGDRPRYEDIAFNDGIIYAINESGDLFAQEVGEDDHGYIVMSSMKLVIKGGDTRGFNVRRLLVVSRGGGLLMVKWNSYGSDDDGISVFEADLRRSRWSRLSSIGDDQVLFVSQRCSKAVHVSPNPNRDDYLRSDSIYFVDHALYGPQKCRFGTTSCGMFDLRSNTYQSIVSDAFRANCIGAASWFFPHYSENRIQDFQPAVEEMLAEA